MATYEYEDGAKRGSMAWLYAPIVLVLFLGGALSIGAYFYTDPQLTMAEALVMGFGGLAGIIVGLFGAAFGIVMGLIGALIGLAAAGGAVAFTLFIVGSPLLAIILIIMLMRRPKSGGSECPDPGAHE